MVIALHSAELPGDGWNKPLSETYEQWKSVHDVVLDLTQKTGIPMQVTFEGDATKPWVVPLAKGMTLRKAMDYVGFLSGFEPTWSAGTLVLKAKKPEYWNATMMGSTAVTVLLAALIGGKPTQAVIYVPTQRTNKGPLPWVWYAPNGLSQANAWMCKRLFDAGIAVVSVSVGESMGNPAGRAAFTEFYDVATSKHGLAKKVVLLPQSRGGLMLYNWAAEHPECVAAIAGIYPVGDLRSYPGMEKAATAYGMTVAELDKLLSQHNPIERLAPIAKAHIPILHVHGDKDGTVPLEKNSAEIAKRYKAIGGDMQVIVIPGGGHTSVSDPMAPKFFQCEALLAFVIKHAIRP